MRNGAAERAWTWTSAAAGIVLRRPAATLVGLAISGCIAAVGWNLTMGQPGRHPAPLFGVKPAEASRRIEAVPLPVPRPDPQLFAQPAPDLAQVPATTQSTDRIGALLRSESGLAAEAEVRRIASAQRALTKLGYGPLKADGLIGPGTKQALERFERDRKLPVTGAVAGRTARQLAQQAGIEIE